MPSEPFWLEVGPFHIVPVCHFRLEFAQEVKRAFEVLQPQRVALELPSFLAPAFQRSVDRLPCRTLLTCTLEEETWLLSVESTDPLVEAVRLATQAGRPWHAIDLEQAYRPQHSDRVADSASLGAIGARAYWEEWSRAFQPRLDPLDVEREAYMANSLLQLAQAHPGDRFLVVVGLAHAQSLRDFLAAGEAPLKVYPRVQPILELWQPAPEVTQALHEEMPWIQVLYQLQRGGPGFESAWQAPPEPPSEPSDPRESLKDLKPVDLVASLEAMLSGRQRRRSRALSPQQRRALSRYLQGLQEEPLALMQLLGQISPSSPPERLELPQVAAPPPARAFSFRQVEDRRGQLLDIYRSFLNGPVLDRQLLIQGLARQSAQFYQENTGEQVKPWQFEVLYQYLRNYARLRGRLLPRLYELTMGARGVADDNWAYEVWDLGGFYPWQQSPSDPLPVITLEQLERNLHLRQWFLRRTLPRLRQRAREAQAGEWAEEFDNGGGICSYPPEDLVIEDYARYLQKKAIQEISSAKVRVEPFTTSLLDGIDMRETLRNWHDRKLFVREERRVQGGVGAVVMIFDEDRNNHRYPWCMTWHGEHSQESDMAFYATPANFKLVGPGISRCEYGGILMTYPNRQLGNVWGDAYYAGQCRSKSEFLLLGALEYGQERHVVYVASEPPRSHFQSLASRLGKRIVYLPIGSLSPQSVKSIRVFHVLSDHGKRQIAKDFIW